MRGRVLTPFLENGVHTIHDLCGVPPGDPEEEDIDPVQLESAGRRTGPLAENPFIPGFSLFLCGSGKEFPGQDQSFFPNCLFFLLQLKF